MALQNPLDTNEARKGGVNGLINAIKRLFTQYYTSRQVDRLLDRKVDFDQVSTNADVEANTAARHTHPNKPLLDTLISSGPGTNFLADDGLYKPAGGGGGVERRNDWNAPYSYCGSAPTGSAESSAVWEIVRVEVYTDGTVDVKSAINVAWTNRYSVIYT